MVIGPENFGVKLSLEEIRGGSPTDNLRALHSVFDGTNQRLGDAVCLNAGALLWIAQIAKSHKEGFTICKAKIADGTVKAHFERILKLAKS